MAEAEMFPYNEPRGGWVARLEQAQPLSCSPAMRSMQRFFFEQALGKSLPPPRPKSHPHFGFGFSTKPGVPSPLAGLCVHFKHLETPNSPAGKPAGELGFLPSQSLLRWRSSTHAKELTYVRNRFCHISWFGLYQTEALHRTGMLHSMGCIEKILEHEKEKDL